MKPSQGTKYNWLLFAVAYIPTVIFTTATCHFVDRKNWIAAAVFFALVLITLPRFKQ